jgi:uncharacterized protein
MNAINSELLYEITAKLVAEMTPTSVYLFGSHAWGAPTQDSDLDLMVLLSDSDEKPHQQYLRARKALRFVRVPLDVIVGSQSEFDRFCTVAVSLQHIIATEGKLLYER